MILQKASSEVMFKFTNIVMYFAPIAVFGALAYTIGKYGVDVFSNLVKLSADAICGVTGLYRGLVFVPVIWIARISLSKFFKAVKASLVTLFCFCNRQFRIGPCRLLVEKLESAWRSP